MAKKFIVPLLNMEKALFDGVGEYGIPVIAGRVKEYDTSTKFIPFNYMQSDIKKNDPSKRGVHFHVHDYQFERLWSAPDLYIDRLKQYRYVCSPEFSIYTNMPKAMQVWNHYRKHWVAAYLQMNGVNIIPTITWALPQTFQFCFDGEPTNSVVCVSTVGTMQTKDYYDNFWMGYYEMKRRLHPSQIIFNGIVPEELKDEVIPLERGYQLFGGKTYNAEDMEKHDERIRKQREKRGKKK